MKIIKGDLIDWMSAGKSGDVIEIRFEVVNGKGVLGFSRNNDRLENICEDIDPPVFPVVDLKGSINRCTLMN